MGRRLLVVAACALACTSAAHPAPPPVSFTKSDQTVRGYNGTKLATTLYVPGPRFDRPAAGWPAVIMFHGLGQTRAPIDELAEQTFASKGYVVLTSGGLFSADGPDEIRDGFYLYKWLLGRPNVDSAHVGLWGISLGGGSSGAC